ncbi:MAG: IclR family transcriptional regulator [Paracoccaceae bacterium]|nr:IclR family transcriptional regulator [Paracoccaceae bacterium]
MSRGTGTSTGTGGGSGERLLAIFDLFSEERPEWSSQELIQRLGYSRPTLYRYLKLLKGAGFLMALPGGGFAIGPRVVELDYLMRRSDPLVEAARPHLAELAGRFPGTAFLARWYGTKLLCVASETRDPAPRSSYPRGRPMPLVRGAAAKAILAHLPRRQQQRLVAGHAAAFAATGLGNSEDAALQALRGIRRAGYAHARGEVTPGLVGTAAAILDAGRIPLAALCLSMPEAAHAKLDSDALARAISTAAAAIANALNADEASAPQALPEFAETRP